MGTHPEHTPRNHSERMGTSNLTNTQSRATHPSGGKAPKANQGTRGRPQNRVHLLAQRSRTFFDTPYMGFQKTSAIFGPKLDPVLGPSFDQFASKKTRLPLHENYIYVMKRLSTLVNDNKATTSKDTSDNELTRR